MQTTPLAHANETRERSDDGAEVTVGARFDLVVFDMAGTTVCDEGDVVARALAGALLDVLGIAEELSAIRDVMGLPKPEAIRALASRSGRMTPPERDVERTHAAFLRTMIRHYLYAPEVREVPGASEVFARLRRRGVLVALDTGFSRAIVDAILARLGWQEGRTVDAVVASDEVARGRPHPDLIFRAMALTGVSDARRVVKVGDTPSDLLEGTAAGCAMVVGVGSGTATLDVLGTYPHTHLVRDVGCVPDLLVPREAPTPRRRAELDVLR